MHFSRETKVMRLYTFVYVTVMRGKCRVGKGFFEL